jgi:hypothetical protein
MTGRQVPDVLLRSARRQIGNERGAVLALVTLLLIVFLGLAALAIDLGLMYVARGEAQRSADAGAHAGAGWLMHNPGASEADIRAAAIEFGTRNLVRGSEVVIKDEDVEILWDERKVRVTAHRTGAEENPVRTLFAGVLGIQTVDVAAVAAAQIWPGEGSDCILPFAIPDHWYVNDGGTLRDASIGDTYIGSRGDVYIPASPASGHDWSLGEPGYTGYGAYRVGQPLQLTSADPSDSPQPGWYYPIRLEGSQGARDYHDSIIDCWDPDGERELGDYVDKEPGNMVGPTRQAFDYIFNHPDEQNMEWDYDLECPVQDGGNTCVGSESRRVRPLVMFDPMEWENIANGAKPVPITAFGGVFLDSWDGNNAVTVRWMRYQTIQAARNWEDCPDCLLQVLRIVE